MFSMFNFTFLITSIYTSTHLYLVNHFYLILVIWLRSDEKIPDCLLWTTTDRYTCVDKLTKAISVWILNAVKKTYQER